jgi:hypothetical protein
MDAAGAEELRKRLEEQAHWAQAPAVQDGRQPPTDRDADELEAMADGIRYYGRETAQELVDGQPALVTSRMIKTLVGDFWETSYEDESIQVLAATWSQ